ncbi:MAG: hypothetical protein H8E71_00020 [Candidatus Marinimicrobia bacterium]|nr:hypothetical protein [Candidatus Neomarinimicrobiota bacterium]
MKYLQQLTLCVCVFTVGACDAINPNTQESADKIIMTIEPSLDVDENGYYHLTLDRAKWQTIHRISGHLNYENGSPAELIKVSWASDLYWVLGDTLGYIVHEGLTDDLVYVSYDTTYITGFDGMEVPTSNQASYSNTEGEVNNMIAPVQIMVGDTMILRLEYFDNALSSNTGEIEIVLD